MSLRWMAVWGVLLLTAQAGAAETTALKTYEEKVSYGLGVDVARNFLRSGIEFDAELLVKGIRDEVARGKLLMTEDELRETMSTFHDEQTRKREQIMNRVAEENRKMGEEFLAENKTQKGVVTLPSGLQYKILKAGSGRKPTDADTVECRFRVALVNGVGIASSDRTGEPATIKVSGHIAGLTEALKLMPVGSKWELFIPPELAYGEKGTMSGIGPNSAVIFEVELLAIK
ncbi:MAG: FKBP-type peptidyl-prolyl cis-trans isomerase N-terminal domain-containing protein [Syntrophales bacterium]